MGIHEHGAVSLWDLLVILDGCAVFGAVLGVAKATGAGPAGLLIAILVGIGLAVLASYLHWKAGERITRSISLASADHARTERRPRLLYFAAPLWIIFAVVVSAVIVRAVIRWWLTA